MNGFYREHWIVLDDAQQRGRGSRWPSPLLLPVLQRLYADADQLSKLGLRKAGSFANEPNTRNSD